MIVIEVVYGTAERQSEIVLELPEPAIVLDAIQASQLQAIWPEIDLTQQRVGIFGKFVALDTLLKNNDRVEIYRPLVIDPKEARQRRVIKKNKK